MSYVVVALPPAPSWTNQAAYEVIFGQVPRIVLASVCAFGRGVCQCLCHGAHEGLDRRAASVVANDRLDIGGAGVDSLIFYPLAFWGAVGWTTHLVVVVLFTQWALKVGWEVLLTPVTYLIVGWLKRAEGVDVFDEGRTFRRSGRRFEFTRSRDGAKRLRFCSRGGAETRRCLATWRPYSFLLQGLSGILCGRP